MKIRGAFVLILTVFLIISCAKTGAEGLEFPVSGPLSLGGGNTYHPVFSPDGTVLAFTKRNDQGVSLWFYDFATGRVTSAAAGLSGDQSFSWTPDGNALYVDAYRDGNPPCWIHRIDIEKKSVSEPLFMGNHPSVSPDGAMMVFARRSDLYLYDFNTRMERRLTRGSSSSGSNWHPSWTSDGMAVLFTSDRSGNRDIWRISVDGGEPENLTSSPSDEDRGREHPDGKRIVFMSDRSGEMNIWEMDLSSGKTELFIESDAWIGHPDWHPQGDALVYAERRNGVFRIQLRKTAIR